MNIFVVLSFVICSSIQGMVEENGVRHAISVYSNEVSNGVGVSNKEARLKWIEVVVNCGTVLEESFASCQGDLSEYKADLKEVCDLLKSKIELSFDVFEAFAREQGGGVYKIQNPGDFQNTFGSFKNVMQGNADFQDKANEIRNFWIEQICASYECYGLNLSQGPKLAAYKKDLSLWIDNFFNDVVPGIHEQRKQRNMFQNMYVHISKHPRLYSGLATIIFLLAVYRYKGSREHKSHEPVASSVPFVNETNIHEFLQKSSENLLIIYVYAPWCGACKRFQPIFDTLATSLSSKYVFAKLNAEISPDLGKRYKVAGFPTLLFIKNGVVIATKAGFRTLQTLLDEIEQL